MRDKTMRAALDQALRRREQLELLVLDQAANYERAQKRIAELEKQVRQLRRKVRSNGAPAEAADPS
jgi:predicted patatin/cPLA2 family phospholipase